MIDKNFVVGLLLAITVVITYNMYYEYKFGDYYRAQEKIAAEKKIIEETGEKKDLVEERASNQPIAPNDRESSNQGTSRVGINAEGPAGDSINKPQT